MQKDYIIVLANKDEKISEIADKFRIEITNKISVIYKVGLTIEVTYTGDINLSNPAQIKATSIRII